MATKKSSLIALRIFTVLFSIPMVFGGIAELVRAPQALEVMKAIGFPLYMLTFLGVAKLLGVVAIATNRYPRLKEWAYAGFTFDLLGAAFCHASNGQAAAAVSPLVIGAVGAISYGLWRRTEGPNPLYLQATSGAPKSVSVAR